MIRWFRRRRPAHRAAPATALAPTDQRAAAWWGYTPEQWAALSDTVRAHKRDQIAHASHGDFGKVKP